MSDRPTPQPLPEDQHLFEPPPPIEKPPPEPMIVHGHISLTLRFEADVARLARTHPREFAAAAERRNGYEPWEQGAVFLWELVHERLDAAVHGIPDALWDRTHFDDTEIDFTWTRQQAAELEGRLAS